MVPPLPWILRTGPLVEVGILGKDKALEICKVSPPFFFDLQDIFLVEFVFLELCLYMFFYNNQNKIVY